MSNHGMSRAPEYTAWRNMKRRCTDPDHPSWAYYGRRGIGYCDRWSSFELFVADMGRRPSASHTLDRIDNDENYEPGNCRWATRSTQMSNTRSNRLLTHDGVTLTITAWAARLGLSTEALHYRLRKGWPIERVLSPHKLKDGRPRKVAS